MDCGEVRDRIAPWLDGELGPAESELVEAHVEECADCARLAEGLSAQEPLLELVRPPDGPPRDPAFWSRMDAALARERAAMKERGEPWYRRRVGVPVPLLAAAGLAAFALAAWGWNRHLEALRAWEQVRRLDVALEREQRFRAPAPAVVRERRQEVVPATYTPSRGDF